MKLIIYIFKSFMWPAYVLLVAPTVWAQTKDQPNVIYILADDLGWAELGCYGNIFNETPNLDQLAKDGIRFTQAYAAAPVCSPYRAALMTGQYPARVGITDYLRPDAGQHLDSTYTTLAEIFQSKGYHTGIIGKWHLSGYVKQGAAEETLPDQHGFDEVIISETQGIGNGSYFHPYHFNTSVDKGLPGQEFLVDRMNLEAVDFIERHQDKPFFLYLSHYAVHTMLHGKPDMVAHFRSKAGAGTSPASQSNPANDPYQKWPADYFAPRNNPHLAAQLKSIDEGVAMIREKLNLLRLSENTLIVFTSDNGGEYRVTDNGSLREGKSTLYEGGIRQPLIVCYPQHLPAGKISHQVTANYDFYPTFCDLLKVKAAKDQAIDGISIWPVLQNPDLMLDSLRTLYWHYPLHAQHFLGGRSSGAIRMGDWKLIEFFDLGTVELYNLGWDVGEQQNRAGEYAEKAKALQQKLRQWRDEVGAYMIEGQAFQ